jgi:hypothetical protein
MAVFLLTCALALPTVSAIAQNANPGADKPAAPATSPVYKSDLGFTYGYSADWELIDTKPLTPVAQQKAAEGAKSDEEKKGAACAQIGLMLKHGDPASIIMTVSLPYDCYGSAFTDADLPGFGTGVSSGLKQNFTVGESKTASYKSGTHNLWVERALATAKADPTQKYTIETVCSMLKKAATCWIGMVKDDAALKVMEQSQVTLESDAPTVLVPADALTAAKP